LFVFVFGYRMHSVKLVCFVQLLAYCTTRTSVIAIESSNHDEVEPLPEEYYDMQSAQASSDSNADIRTELVYETKDEVVADLTTVLNDVTTLENDSVWTTVQVFPDPKDFSNVPTVSLPTDSSIQPVYEPVRIPILATNNSETNSIEEAQIENALGEETDSEYAQNQNENPVSDSVEKIDALTQTGNKQIVALDNKTIASDAETHSQQFDADVDVEAEEANSETAISFLDTIDSDILSYEQKEDTTTIEVSTNVEIVNHHQTDIDETKSATSVSTQQQTFFSSYYLIIILVVSILSLLIAVGVFTWLYLRIRANNRNKKGFILDKNQVI
jgi:hypothetical protein